jgi:hypothetical protein
LEVDVALVLAIDASGSIDYEEAELQRKGIAEAILSKEVQDAIKSGSLGRIGIAAVYFSSRQFGVMSVPVNWMVIRDQKSAEDFVRTLIAAVQSAPGRQPTRRTIAAHAGKGAIPSAKQVIHVSVTALTMPAGAFWTCATRSGQSMRSTLFPLSTIPRRKI